MATGTIPLDVKESILSLLNPEVISAETPGNVNINLETLEYQIREPPQPKTDSQNIIANNQPRTNDGILGVGGDGYNWNFIGGLVIGQLSVFMIMVIFIRFFIFADSSPNSRDYSTHLRQNRRPKILPSSVATTEKILEKTYYNVDSHPSETLDWFSVLVAQAINQVREDVRTNENIIKSLNDAFISIGNMPKFLDKIEVTELNIGEDFPIFSNCRISPSDDDPTRLEAQIDVDLRDNITLGIMTKLLMNYPKALFAVLPVALSVSVKRFSGTLTVSLRTLTTTTTTTTTTAPTNTEAKAPLESVENKAMQKSAPNSDTHSPSLTKPKSSMPSSSLASPSSSSSSTNPPIVAITLENGENKSRSVLKEPNFSPGSTKSNVNSLNNSAPGSSSSNSSGSGTVNTVLNSSIGTSITTTVNEKTYLTFSFSSDYILEFSINSSIGSKSKTQLLDLPKIGQMVESRLHKWFIDRCVEPRYQQVPLPSFWPRKKTTKEKDQNIPSTSYGNTGDSAMNSNSSPNGSKSILTSTSVSPSTVPSSLITTTTTTTTTTATSLSPMTGSTGMNLPDRGHRYSMNYGLSPVSNVTMALGPGPDDMESSRSLRNRRLSSIARHR